MSGHIYKSENIGNYEDLSSMSSEDNNKCHVLF